MEKILNRPGKPTNIKPDSWYEDYLRIDIFLDTIEEIKKLDVMANNNQSHDNVSGFLQFGDKNNLDVNRRLLKHYKKELKSLPKFKAIENPLDIKKDSEQFYIQRTLNKIDLCSKALEQGYLITAQLEDIYVEVKNYWYNEESAKPILNLLRQFKFGNYQEELSNFIKLNTNYRDEDRDFKIYREIQMDTLYSELAEQLGCSVSNISKVNKKVRDAINNLKGRFFEIEYEKYLRSLNKFRNCEIIRDGNPGKPDIYITDGINKELYIFSLKNLEINKKSYSITTEQLKPELEFAYYNYTFEAYNNVFLYLIVFDSLTKRLYVKEIDFKNPKNITISR